MRRVRLTARAFINHHLHEPGDEVLIADNAPLAAHMVDVRTGEEGEPTVADKPMFLDHSADKPFRDGVLQRSSK